MRGWESGGGCCWYGIRGKRNRGSYIVLMKTLFTKRISCTTGGYRSMNIVKPSLMTVCDVERLECTGTRISILIRIFLSRSWQHSRNRMDQRKTQSYSRSDMRPSALATRRVILGLGICLSCLSFKTLLNIPFT